MSTFKLLDNKLKPRERLKYNEPNGLSDAELLAIIIGTGTKTSDVIETANKLLIEFGGLNMMQSTTINEFKTIHGIGEAKATILFAMFEITKRANKEKFYLKRDAVNKPEIVYELCKDLIHLHQEKVMVLSLNIRMELIAKTEVYVGELSSVSIQPREIFKTVFTKSAYGFILVHNHPSGYCGASDDDLIATQAIVSSAKLLNVMFVDHIVVAKDGFYSIRGEHPSIFNPR